jgi:hypothetical protein
MTCTVRINCCREGRKKEEGKKKRKKKRKRKNVIPNFPPFC